jgi:tRNA uridine 5-carbamoylmethylation protein Kti12
MKLLFIYGPPAAGKLTVATELARLTGYRMIDNHRATDYLLEVFPRSNPAYEKVRSQLGRKIRLDIYAAAAKADANVITTFAPISAGMHDFVRAVKDAVESAGGEFCPIQLLPSHEIMEQRVLSESRKDRKIDNVARWHEVVDGNQGAFETFPDFEHLTIDNSELSPEEAAKQIIEHYKVETL